MKPDPSSGKKKKKRAKGSRIHRKLDSYREGRMLLDRMQSFASTCLEEKPGSRIFAAEVLELFFKVRGPMSVLEVNLSKQHMKKLVLQQWPSARYSCYQKKKAYFDLCFKDLE